MRRDRGAPSGSPHSARLRRRPARLLGPGPDGTAAPNLLVNAIKHGAADGAVSLRATENAAQVRIDVHNFGRQIPAGQRHRLFQPLTRGVLEESSDPAMERSVGLGLYIASEIAKAHGGTLQLALSDDENGTTFCVLLPRIGVQP